MHVELNQNLPNLIDLDAAPASHLILVLDWRMKSSPSKPGLTIITMEFDMYQIV
jgi:hypothetical protein